MQVSISKNEFKIHLDKGNKLRKEGKFAEAIKKYTQALQSNPNCILALIGLAAIYESRKEYDRAIAHYQQVVEINPQHSISYAKLGKVMMLQGNIYEAIAAYQKAITIKANLPAWVYIELGNALRKNQELDEAVTAYQKAIEIKPNNQAIYRLLEESQALKQDGDIYLKIWSSLNQTNLDDFDNARSSYPRDIDQEVVSEYFNSHSNYKVIHLPRLNEEDEQFIQDAGLSLKYLKLNLQKPITREEIAGQKTSYGGRDLEFLEDRLSMIEENCQRYQLPMKGRDSRNRLTMLTENCQRRLSIIQEGYVSAICPFSGIKVSSNRSLFLTPAQCFYRFVGQEVFYLIFNAIGTSLYIPSQELLLMTTLSKCNGSIVNAWKTYIVTNWDKIASYLNNSSQVKTVAVVGLHHFGTGHSLIDDLSGIQMLSDSGNLNKVDKYLVVNGTEYYGGIDEIFPEIDSEKVKRVELFQIRDEIIENNYLGVRLGERFVRDSLAQRIYQASLKKCSSDLLAEVEVAKKDYFPLIWVNCRLGSRRWLSQVEGIAKILKSLAKDFPKLGVVFDGISRTDIHGNLLFNPKDEEGIKKEKDNLSQIQSLLPQEIKIYDVIGCPMYEQLLWAHAIDLYMSPFGGGLSKVVSIANKPGVMHSSKSSIISKEYLLYHRLRKNSAFVTPVSEHHIVDSPDDKFTKKLEINRSYDCDWRGIYEKVLKLASSLKRD